MRVHDANRVCQIRYGLNVKVCRNCEGAKLSKRQQALPARILQMRQRKIDGIVRRRRLLIHRLRIVDCPTGPSHGNHPRVSDRLVQVVVGVRYRRVRHWLRARDGQRQRVHTRRNLPDPLFLVRWDRIRVVHEHRRRRGRAALTVS
jgi:hypothetical protein